MSDYYSQLLLRVDNNPLYAGGIYNQLLIGYLVKCIIVYNRRYYTNVTITNGRLMGK